MTSDGVTPKGEARTDPAFVHQAGAVAEEPEAAIDDRGDPDAPDGSYGMCQACCGTGGDPWNDGITPCEYCDGEGYEWWN